MTEPTKRIIEAHDVTFANVLGKVLRERRESLGHSQSFVATFAELDQSTLSRIERGQTDVTVGNLRRLCVPLKCNAAVVLEAAEAMWARL